MICSIQQMVTGKIKKKKLKQSGFTKPESKVKTVQGCYLIKLKL